MNEFLKTFKERGFFHQATDWEGLEKLPRFTAYIGFDLTATSLHVGSLVQIMLLRWLQKTGNKPIILFGGGTTKVGDPSGKDESRPVITDEVIAENKAGISKVFDKFINLDNAQIVDNDEWLDGLNYLEFLREVGRHFSVNRMIAKESVKARLDRDSHMSFLEFNYMVLQAYDFVKLSENYGCRVQIGGSDQWGNITEGMELGRRLGLKEDLFGLTTPLITTSSGAKMGKTADGAIWLDAEKTSPYDYYQFWRNTDDADVGRFLKLFTELPMDEISKLEQLQGSEINEAKKVLAFEATKLCHGEAEASKAADAATTAFEQGGTAGLPEVELEAGEMPAFMLFKAAGLADSNNAAKKLIQGGGARVDDEKVTDESAQIQIADGMKLSSGKKKHFIVKLK